MPDRILIVEDDPLISEELSLQLMESGYDVIAVVASGEEAVRKAGKTRPDLVIMDIRLPGGMDGIEAASSIRQKLDTAIVYLTAHTNDSELADRAKVTEPQGYLSKAATPNEFENAVEMALYKHRMERRLRESEETYRSLTEDVLDGSNVGIFVLSADFTVVWVNRTLERFFGLPRGEAIGKDKRQLIRDRIRHIFYDPEEFAEKVTATYANNTYVEEFECHIRAEEGREERWLQHWSKPIGRGLYAGGRIEVYYDITERKRGEEERESLLIRLQQALAEVRKLSGLLPLCASCKKIRDDKGHWQHMEVYIRDHSEAEFTHSLCPECSARLYPDLTPFEEE